MIVQVCIKHHSVSESLLQDCTSVRQSQPVLWKLDVSLFVISAEIKLLQRFMKEHVLWKKNNCATQNQRHTSVRTLDKWPTTSMLHAFRTPYVNQNEGALGLTRSVSYIIQNNGQLRHTTSVSRISQSAEQQSHTTSVSHFSQSAEQLRHTTSLSEQWTTPSHNISVIYRGNTVFSASDISSCLCWARWWEEWSRRYVVVFQEWWSISAMLLLYYDWQALYNGQAIKQASALPSVL